MVTDTVTNSTTMVWRATRSFQAVGKLVTSSKLLMHQIATKTCELSTKFLLLSLQKWLDSIFNFEPCSQFHFCFHIILPQTPLPPPSPGRTGGGGGGGRWRKNYLGRGQVQSTLYKQNPRSWPYSRHKGVNLPAPSTTNCWTEPGIPQGTKWVIDQGREEKYKKW